MYPPNLTEWRSRETFPQEIYLPERPPHFRSMGGTPRDPN